MLSLPLHLKGPSYLSISTLRDHQEGSKNWYSLSLSISLEGRSQKRSKELGQSHLPLRAFGICWSSANGWNGWAPHPQEFIHWHWSPPVSSPGTPYVQANPPQNPHRSHYVRQPQRLQPLRGAAQPAIPKARVLHFTSGVTSLTNSVVREKP